MGPQLLQAEVPPLTLPCFPSLFSMFAFVLGLFNPHFLLLVCAWPLLQSKHNSVCCHNFAANVGDVVNKRILQVQGWQSCIEDAKQNEDDGHLQPLQLVMPGNYELLANEKRSTLG